VGTGYRKEKFYVRGSATEDGNRNVFDAYAESSLPLVGPENAITGIRALQLDASVRTEHYSDFGGTTNPKLGLTWTVSPDLNFRGSWGKSFKAPTLYQRYAPVDAFVFGLPDPVSPTGSTLSVLALGGHPGLGPERSNAYTLGLDFTPQELKGLTVSLTYFNIDFTDRIQIVNSD